MDNALYTEANAQEELQSESSWEVGSVASDQESPFPSESESGSDEESGDEILHCRRRRYCTIP